MSKVTDALDALRAAQELLDDLEEWAAAGHVSTATSLLYNTLDDDRPMADAGYAPVSWGTPDHYLEPRNVQAPSAQQSSSFSESPTLSVGSGAQALRR